jgi:hypothetical protein
MDEADLANDHIEKEMALRLKTMRHATLPFKGTCYDCDEELQAPKRFCDADCRDMYERRVAAARRNGTG